MEIERTPEEQEERREAVREAYKRNAGNGHLPMARIVWLDAINLEETLTPMQYKPQEVICGGFLLDDINDGNTRICQSYGEDVEEGTKYREVLIVPDSLIINKVVIPEAS